MADLLDTLRSSPTLGSGLAALAAEKKPAPAHCHKRIIFKSLYNMTTASAPPRIIPSSPLRGRHPAT